MDTVLTIGVLTGIYFLFNKRENYDNIDNKISGKINQEPVKTTQAMMDGYNTVPAFPQPVGYSLGKLGTPMSTLEDRLAKSDEPNLLDLNKRPMSDFLNNNFIPNRNRDTQNMIGTGVYNGNFLPDKYNTGGDPAQLLSRRELGFSTDTDPTFKHKVESGPRFSPAETTTWVHGTPDIRPDLDRFKQDINRNKNYEKPTETVFYVGPGVGLDPSVPASGGFNAGLMNRVTPNNVLSHNINQLPGGVIKGKMPTELPTANPGFGPGIDGNQYGVPNNKKPKTYITYDERPPLPLGISSLEAQKKYPNMPDREPTKAATYGFGTLVRNN